MTEKYVWLIGGSVMSEPMCQEIRSRGYKILLTDSDPNCYCSQLSDLFMPISVYDVEESLYLAQSSTLNGIKIMAVLTIGTDAGPTVSALSDFYDLPGIGQDKAEMVKDKIRMRKALGLPTPYFFAFHRGSTGLGYFPPDKFPMVVKPPDQAGSRGFKIAQDNESLHEIVKDTKGDLIFEEMLTAKDLIPEWRERYGLDTSEAAFDFFVEGDKITYANGALRLFWVDQPGIEAGHINPFERIVTDDDMDQILKLATVAAHRLELTWGVLKIDVKKDVHYGWCLLECATRLSGGFDHMYTSSLATGRNVTGAMLDIALGQPLDTEKLRTNKYIFACCFAPRYKPGPIDGWAIYDNESDRIFEMTQNRIKPIESNQDRPLFIIASSNTPYNAFAKAKRVTAFVDPLWE